MSTIATALKHMLAADMPHDAIVAAVAEMEAGAPKVRTAGALRQERYRRNKASQVTKSDACDVTTTPSLDKEIPPTPPKEIKPTPVLLSAREELETVLDAKHAGAVLEHRQRIRKPMTAHAAHLLAASFSKAPDPNAAADEMIERGWQGFKPGWLESRTSQHHSTAPPTHAERVNEALNKIINGHSHEHPGPTIDASINRTDCDSSASLVQLDTFAARRRS